MLLIQQYVPSYVISVKPYKDLITFQMLILYSVKV